MHRWLLPLVVVSLALPSLAQKKNKSDMPMAVVAAQFVYITSFDGDIYDPHATTEDRAAMQKVESALRAWGKYDIVYQPQQADLMLIVKPAYIAQGRVGIDVGTGDPHNPGVPGARIPIGGTPGSGVPPDSRLPASTTGVDVSSTPDDMLMVSLSPQESPSETPVVWRRTAHHGFVGNKPALVEAFRDAVDQAAKQKP